MSEKINIDKPGAGALLAMQNLNNTDVVFKKPEVPTAKKKYKRFKVLDEDTYIEELGKIIQRDFFPDLEKLKAQNDYLEAIERNDVVKMRELYAKYSSGKPLSERVASPATFDTPITKPNETPGSTPMTHDIGMAEGHFDQEKSKPKQSLDEYLATHTSEDNMSFQDIMDAAERKLRQKFNILYGVEGQNPELLDKMLTLPSFEEQIELRTAPKNIDTWTYTNKNYIMYVPDCVELTKDEKIEMAKLKQEITHSNTRLNCNPFDEQQSKETISEIAKMQKRTLDGRIGVDGNTLTTSARGQIRGYGFVATPSPHPSQMGESPLMTWGEIEGTPFRLDGGGTPLLRTGTGPAFKIADTPRREKIAHALADKAGERHRGLKKKAMDAAKRQMTTPSPRPASSLERLASMSPAARRLVTGKLVSGPLGSIRSGTPTPSPKASATPKSKATPTLGALKLKSTPDRKRSKIISSSGKFDVSIVNKNDLTDDLLNINVPKRKTASDYF